MEIKVNPDVLSDSCCLVLSFYRAVNQRIMDGVHVCAHAPMCVCLYTVSYLYIILYHTIVSFFFIGVMVAAQGLGYMI